MTEKQFKKDEVIFHEGASGECLYRITDGTVGIFLRYGTADEKKLTELGKDQFFGEMAVVEAYPRSATAVALSDVTATEVSSDELAEFFKSQPDTIIEIMKHLGTRIRELTDDYSAVNETIAELGLNKDSKERSEGLIARIKKFAGVYAHNRTNLGAASIETLRKIDRKAHADGYSKNVETFKKGTIIFKEGETGNCMYDIHFGKVGIYKNYGTADEKLLTELNTDKFFGELGMLDGDKRSATAVALEDDTMLETIYAADLKELFASNPPKIEMLIAHMSYRLRKLTNSYMEACKLVYEVSSAEESGSISADLKDKVSGYKAQLYD